MEILSKIQQGLNVPKKHFNKFGNFHYRKTEDIFEALRPLLGKNSLLATVEVVQISDRFYMRTKLELLDAAGKVLVTTYGWAREPLKNPNMDESQTSGSAMTYSLKYALNNMFLLEDSQDPDEMNHRGGNKSLSPKSQTKAPPVLEQAEKAREELGDRFDQSVANQQEAAQPTRPAPTQQERQVLKFLSEYWVTQFKSPNLKLDGNKIMDILYGKLGHYPTLDECAKLKDPNSPFYVPLESITTVKA